MNGEKIYWCHQGKDKHKADKAMNKFKSETAQVGNVLSSFLLVSMMRQAASNCFLLNHAMKFH
jgi:hypothetical protein